MGSLVSGAPWHRIMLRKRYPPAFGRMTMAQRVQVSQPATPSALRGVVKPPRGTITLSTVVHAAVPVDRPDRAGPAQGEAGLAAGENLWPSVPAGPVRSGPT